MDCGLVIVKSRDSCAKVAQRRGTSRSRPSDYTSSARIGLLLKTNRYMHFLITSLAHRSNDPDSYATKGYVASNLGHPNRISRCTVLFPIQASRTVVPPRAHGGVTPEQIQSHARRPLFDPRSVLLQTEYEGGQKGGVSYQNWWLTL
jgi:hypothetical protein